MRASFLGTARALFKILLPAFHFSALLSIDLLALRGNVEQKDRHVIATEIADDAVPADLALAATGKADFPRTTGAFDPVARPRFPCEMQYRAMTWAQRLKRVFMIDIETCRRCGGKLRVMASIEEPAVIERILDHLGRMSEPLDRARAPRAPPQCEAPI